MGAFGKSMFTDDTPLLMGVAPLGEIRSDMDFEDFPQDGWG